MRSAVPHAAWFALLLAAGCVEPLAPGEVGTPRHFGVVEGDAPLDLLPPVVDRDGNLYVLWGRIDLPEVAAFVGHAGGGWSAGCDQTDGSVGVRGWVGTTDRRAWYWSGSALVELRGDTGDCRRLLERDPRTGTELEMLGVIPALRETSSGTSAVALVRGAGDQQGFVTVLDLDRQELTGTRSFEPDDARNLMVHGVGTDPDLDLGIALVSYSSGGERLTELRWYDRAAQPAGRVRVDDVGQERTVGHLQVGADGLIAALLDDGRLLRASRDAAATGAVTGMSAVGVHQHRGALYLVGESAGRPVAAPLRGSSADIVPLAWELSEQVERQLRSGLAVLDDRSPAREYIRWGGVRSAIGSHPFLSAHDPGDYAVDVAGWLVAGPGYQTGGIDYTAVAHLPIGIDYP